MPPSLPEITGRSTCVSFAFGPLGTACTGRLMGSTAVSIRPLDAIAGFPAWLSDQVMPQPSAACALTPLGGPVAGRQREPVARGYASEHGGFGSRLRP